jgi:hypothetical protein
MHSLKQVPRIAAAIVLGLELLTVAACDPHESALEAALPDEEEPGIPRLPSEFTNLEVLSADITKDELKQHMKLITKSLGTKCDYCHRTDIRDYASDELLEKRIARKMMRLVERINRDHFTWKDAPEATCFMCHHGELKPQLEPTIPVVANEAVNP